MQGKAAYTRPKVVGLFPGPCASGSYVHPCCAFYTLNFSEIFSQLPIAKVLLGTLTTCQIKGANYLMYKGKNENQANQKKT
jgi:hypothetical protein